MKLTPYTKIDELLTAKRIKVYTYQNINVLSKLAESGYITGEHDFSLSRFDDGEEGYKMADFFGPPYIWMQNQMKKRLKNYTGELPVWCWTESRGNINVVKRFGEDQVRIVANIPVSRCLISDFDLYEAGPMNKMYFSYNTRKMEQQFEEVNLKEYEKDKKVKLKYKFEPTQEELEKGWELIFNLSKHVGTSKFREYVGIENEGRYLQVCVDRIYEDEIEQIKIYDNFPKKKLS